MPTKAIIFFGTEAWGVPSLRAMAAAGLTITAVVTKPDAPAGRKRVLTPTPVKVAALELGLTVLEPATSDELAATLKAHPAELGMLIAYGKIIPQAVLDLFPLGILNLHPSALPAFRGPSPIESAILEGAPVGDISIIELSAAMDAGPVVLQRRLELPDAAHITAPAAYEAIGTLAASLVVEAVQSALDGHAQFMPQDESAMTLSRMISKADGVLDPTKSAAQLAREVRAYLGWPGSRVDISDQTLIVTAAHVGEALPGELALVTSDGTLILDRVIPAGKNEMTGRAYLAGHRAA